MASTGAGTPDISLRQLTKSLAGYREANTGRSVSEIAITAGALVLLWGLMWAALQGDRPWLYAALIVPTAGFLMRLFMIQHDCGHGAFFRSRRSNDWLGRMIGILTLTPYDYWRRTHAAHHATSGNLDRRGMGDVTTLTVQEFRRLSWLGQLRYRLYRHPAVMFGIGPVYLFFLQNRIPGGLVRAGREPWLSAMATNAGIVVLAGGLIWLVGVQQALLLYVPVAVLAASVGVWLFYVQHQFEATFWARAADWDAREAALHGSSYYDLPPILSWMTANIGVHHVHHLSSRIPYYRLPEVLRDHPELKSTGRLTVGESFRCVPLVLWDEEKQRMVSFRELRRTADPLCKMKQPQLESP